MFDAGNGAVDLAALDRRAMPKLRGNAMAMIFQEPMTSLNPIYSVGEQIMESLRLHRGRVWLRGPRTGQDFAGKGPAAGSGTPTPALSP